jgi:hypothetical protein
MPSAGISLSAVQQINVCGHLNLSEEDHMVRKKINPQPGDPAAGNGILSRRVFLEGALLAGAAGASASDAMAEPVTVQPWMKVPGAGFAGYGQPSRFEN